MNGRAVRASARRVQVAAGRKLKPLLLMLVLVALGLREALVWRWEADFIGCLTG